MNADVAALKRLIRLPAEVQRCEWQTGKRAEHDGDWWVAAVLAVGAEQMGAFLAGAPEKSLFETPPGLQLSSSFAALKSLPDARVVEGRVRVVTDVHNAAPYRNSPLLNGNVIRLSATDVLVVLWTQ